MGEAKFFDQALQTLRFFQRVQVFALHVLNQRHGGSGLIRHVAHQHRHAVEPGQFGRAEAPLARKDRAIYDAINAAMEEVKNTGALPVVLGALPDGLKVRSFFRPGTFFQSAAKENTHDKQ